MSLLKPYHLSFKEKKSNGTSNGSLCFSPIALPWSRFNFSRVAAVGGLTVICRVIYSIVGEMIMIAVLLSFHFSCDLNLESFICFCQGIWGKAEESSNVYKDNSTQSDSTELTSTEWQ